MPSKVRKAWLASLTTPELEALRHDWRFWAHAAQCPPAGDWRIWLFLGGRGAGKTRAGAEWVAENIRSGHARRIALVAPSFSEAREVMLAGPSGLLSIGRPGERPVYEPTRRRLVWANGALGYIFSAEEPEALRGPQFDLAWADEIAAWPAEAGETAFANLELGLRLGEAPKIVATTTPRATALLRQLLARPDCVETRAATEANRANLAPGFLSAMEAAFGGTQRGRQELLGEWLDAVEGALWTRADLERARGPAPSRYDEIVVAVDPAISAGKRADCCGIIGLGALGSGRARRAFVIADHSARGLNPHQWAARAAALAAAIGADAIVAEANQGGELVADALRLAAPDHPVRLVHARSSKMARAELARAFYEQGRVVHIAALPALEDEMCRFGAPGFAGSPDRLDALVWGLSALLSLPSEPRIRRL